MSASVPVQFGCYDSKPSVTPDKRDCDAYLYSLAATNVNPPSLWTGMTATTTRTYGRSTDDK